METLTSREAEVLRLICGGFSTKEIAAKLAITFRTAATHRYRILEKAGVHNAVGLLWWALQHGYVSLEPPDDQQRATSAKSGSS